MCPKYAIFLLILQAFFSFEMKRVLINILLSLNILAIIAMFVSAYSVYLHPSSFPNWSYLGMLFPMPLCINVMFCFIWLILKRKYALFPLLSLCMCIGSIRDFVPINLWQGTPQGTTIRVLSYNVMSFGRKDGSEDWDDNEILNYIIEQNADIVCLQEPCVSSFEVVKEKLHTNYPYIELSDNYEMIMAILSKYPIINKFQIDTSSKLGCSFAFDIVLNNDTITVLNNHLESYKLNDDDKAKYKEIFRDIYNHSSQDNIQDNFWLLEDKLAKANKIRASQADTIDAFIARCKSKYIISCGDFNDCPNSYVHRVMTRHLKDAYTRSGNGFGFSYHLNGMFFRIDNILVSDNITPYYAFVDDSIDKSDHYPIICTLEL